METRPMPLTALCALPGELGALGEFRIAARREIAAVLERLAGGNVALALCPDPQRHAAAGVKATVWTADADRATLGLAVDPAEPGLDALVDARDAVAVGYLDHVKLQFDLHSRVLVRGKQACVLNCAYPLELYRFQRRSGYRVRPALRTAPVVRVRHSEIPEMQLVLRVLDLSIGGCALFLPDDVPALRPGVVWNQVQIELDADTHLRTNLRLQHVTSVDPDVRGTRLGCEFVHTAGDAQRALQRFIDQTQKRGRLLV